MLEEKQIPIFVISLARVPERRASIENHLRRYGLIYEIYDAVDGAQISEADRASLQADNVSFSPGVVGCYLSHIGVYKEVVRRGLDVALVLEDDARLNPAICGALRSGRIFRDYDYCLLDCDDVSEETPVYYDPDTRLSLTEGFPIYRTNVGPALLHAYLITREGAEKRLNHAFPIRKPVDVYSHLAYTPNILVCVKPKGAWVSEHSRQSYTSNRNDVSPLRMRFLRRHSFYFTLLDWLRLKPIIGRLSARRLRLEGVLQPDRRWRPMPSGRNIPE